MLKCETILGALLLFNTSNVIAEAWHCRNSDVEISCHKAKCEVSDSFTPLDVYFDRQGNMSVGMYSGVWEGQGKMTNMPGYLLVMGKDLVFSASPDSKENFLVVLDVRDNVAVFKGADYAMPMVCEHHNLE